MNIRVATTADIPRLCILLNFLFSQEQEFTPNTEIQTSGLAKIINNPEVGVIFVATEDDAVLGMVSLLFTVSTALGGQVALLEDMVVADNARNAGIGSQLITHAINYAKISSCKRITLLTDRANVAAQRFYCSHGFEFSSMVPYRLVLE